MLRWTVPLLLALAACKKDPVDSDLLTCGPSASTLGTAGRTAIDRLDVAWTHDAARDVWVGAPVRAIVPDDVVGLSITVDGGPAATVPSWVALDERVVLDVADGREFGSALTAARAAPGDSVGETAWDSAWDSAWATGDTGSSPVDGSGLGAWPFFLYPDVASTITLPMNDATQPWPGCLVVVPIAASEPLGGTVHVATKRSSAEAVALDVNLVRVGALDLSEAELSATMGRVEEVLVDQAGLGIDEVVLFDLDQASAVPSSGSGLHALRASVLPGASTASVTVFLAERLVGDPGTLGFAAGIPGASVVKGTAGSGVLLSLAAHRTRRGGLDTRLLGETLAHELGHQLGLFHTTESDGGEFDVIDDTPECRRARYDADGDGELSAEECVDADGRHLMFWVSGDLPQDVVSGEQARMLARQPAAHDPEEP